MEPIVKITAETLEDLFHRYYEPLCRYAFSMLRQQESAEELVQDLFIRLWEKRRETVISTDVKAYLYRSVYNAGINIVKQRQRGPQLTDVSDVHYLYSDSAPDHSLSRNELEVLIEEAVHQLPEKCALVFKLSRFEKLSHKEIAEQMDISVKTVENHMGKALQHMRMALQEYLPLFLITFLLGHA